MEGKIRNTQHARLSIEELLKDEISKSERIRAVILIGLLALEALSLLTIYFFYSEEYLNVFRSNIALYAILIFTVAIIIYELFVQIEDILKRNRNKKVKSCILATRIPQKPEDIPSQVLCDADMAHLADDDYFKIIVKLRSEWNKTLKKKFNKRKFYKISEEFFGQHNYFTVFARKELEPKKSDNLRLIEKEISLLEQKNEIKFSEKKQKKAKGYARGVESMFRLLPLFWLF